MTGTVLLVDDGRAYAPGVVRQLARDLGGGATVDYSHSTTDAVHRLAAGSYTAAVVDVLFRPDTEAFERDRRAGGVSPRTGPFLVSGLAVLRAAQQARVPALIWSDGGDERLLHMRYAYEEFGTRVFCLKDDPGLADAVRAVRAGRELVPRPLGESGLRPKANRVADSLFRRPPWAKLWRILAVTETATHDDLKQQADGWFRYARRLVGDMATEAANLYEFTPAGSNALTFCNRFASRNALFLMDATVHERHP
jgi:hypothetical protein